MKASTKKWLGFLSWVPLTIFTASVIYFIYVSRSALSGQGAPDHYALSYYIDQYYNEMFVWLAAGSVIGIAVLIRFVVHLLRLKYMHPATKALWFVFMAFTGSFALPLFYYFELKREPEHIPLKESIE